MIRIKHHRNCFEVLGRKLTDWSTGSTIMEMFGKQRLKTGRHTLSRENRSFGDSIGIISY